MKKAMFGNEMDRMPGWSFRVMALLFNVADRFKSPDRRLDPFGLRPGQTVVDYGCGTGRYLKQASLAVGPSGRVYAVDIHVLAVESAHTRIRKHALGNVTPVLTDGRSVDIPGHTADVVYALDMFHMVKDTGTFLRELHRITRPDGVLFIEDGHQPRAQAREKINASGCWQIVDESRQFLKCKPV